MNKIVIVTCSAVVGGLMFAYCIYFDRKRRKQLKLKKTIGDDIHETNANESDASVKVDIPSSTDVHTYMINEMLTGQKLISIGNVREGVDHMINAVSVYKHPEHLLDELRQRLNDNAFRLLLKKLSKVSPEFRKIADRVAVKPNRKISFRVR